MDRACREALCESRSDSFDIRRRPCFEALRNIWKRGLTETNLAARERSYEGSREKAKSQIGWLLQLEERPSTLNDHYYLDYRNKFMGLYKKSRQETNQPLVNRLDAYTPPTGVPDSSKITKALAALAEAGFNVKAEELPRLLPPDPMEPALTIMASVRAYIQVAYKRVVDNVAMAVDQELVRGQAELEQTLRAGLGLTGPDGHRICQELSLESREVASIREELTKKRERLSKASRELVFDI